MALLASASRHQWQRNDTPGPTIILQVAHELARIPCKAGSHVLA